MSQLGITQWLADKEQLALSFSPGGLQSFFKKTFIVPSRVVALLLKEDQDNLVYEDESACNFETAFLVKLEEIPIAFSFFKLFSNDNHSFQVELTFFLQVIPKKTYLQLLRSNVVNGRDLLSKENLGKYFQDIVKEGITSFVGQKLAENLYKKTTKEDFDIELKEVLKALLFDSGLEYLRLDKLSFYSKSYEKILKKEQERMVHQEEQKNQEMLQEMKKRLVLEEVNATKEAEQLKQYLSYQGVLKELELRKEIHKKKQDEKLEKYDELYEKMGKDDVKALIFLLEDEKLKSELIQGLIEKNMTTDQLEAKQKKDFQREMEEKLNFFTNQMNQMMKKNQGAHLIKPKFQTRRVYVCCGQEVISFDPKTNRFPEQPKEVYSFQDKDLGYLRSIRVLKNGLLLGGGQKGVYQWNTSKDEMVKEFSFPMPSKGRGGVNSIVYHEDSILASHSEQGIISWDSLGLKEPAYLLKDITQNQESVRGIILKDQKIYFSVGSKICCSHAPFETSIFYTGSSTSITSFLVYENFLLAGNTNGRILKWNLADKTSPSELSFRKSSPIYMMKIVFFGEEPYLLVGAKDYSLHAISLNTEQLIDFQGKDAIRWVDGASDYVYGVDRSGYKILVWSVSKPTQPLLIWRTPDKIQDITVVTEPLI